MVIPAGTRAWLLVIPLIPSIIVTIFNLYHLLKDQALRTGVNNHFIICLLLCILIEELTDVVWNIYFNFTQMTMIATPMFCTIWIFTSSVLIVSIYLLMMWGAVERYIFIFHSAQFATKMKRFYFHYLPLILCFLWPLLYYTVLFLIASCTVQFDYRIRLCNRYSCITRLHWVSLWDSFIHFLLPPFVVVNFSIILLIRVFYQRYRIRQQIDWRNYKKLVGQLLPISFVYVVIGLPPMSLYAAYAIGLSRSIAIGYYSDSMFFAYWIVLFTPFATVVSLPDLQTKCKNAILFWRRRRIVFPEIMTITRLRHQRRTALPAVCYKITYISFSPFQISFVKLISIDSFLMYYI
ncbi:unnamed protein product [Adineta ricciae]|uniref:G-protein coupled receptors family 1 profile domain-containing protein n=1 Tax=Adineta ricciae TaxID=249248 RepID=A0A815EUR6_ADIRI|nr:unnamed protein product [Adineta ricciae]CAF1319605.1 unnamed protein product [Adineta ricciae]